MNNVTIIIHILILIIIKINGPDLLFTYLLALMLAIFIVNLKKQENPCFFKLNLFFSKF